MMRGLILWAVLLVALRAIWREFVGVWTGDDSRGWWT